MAEALQIEPFKTLCVEKGYLSAQQAAEMAGLFQHVSKELGLPKPFLEICLQKKLLTPEQVKAVSREAAQRMGEAAKAAKKAQAESKSARPPGKRRIKELGGFVILEQIGAGAMGAVFKVRQKSLDRIVALKILPPKLAKNKLFVERFKREARASAALNHPNIVQGIDVGEDQGLYYFAMEFIEGETVRSRFEREGPLPLRDVLEIGRQTALALAHAHGKGLVHRDIKPDNLMFDRQGANREGFTIKVMDLGLARAVSEQDAAMTQSGTAVGTPFYISPEQARGETELTPACDLYSLGGTLLHIASGKPPYEGQTSAVIMAKHLTEPPPDPKALKPDLPDDVAGILQKLLVKEPTQRYASAEALAGDLERVLKGERPKHIPLTRRHGKSTGPVRPITLKGGTTKVRGTGPLRGVTTKKRRPVRDRKGAEEPGGTGGPSGAPQAKQFPVVPVAAGGVALVLGLVVWLASSGGSVKPSAPSARAKSRTQRKPPRRTAGPSLRELAEQRRMQALQAAKAAARAKLQGLEERYRSALGLERSARADLAAQEQAWRELKKTAAGTPYALKAERKLEALRQKRILAAQAARNALLAKAKAQAQTGDYDGALALLKAPGPAFQGGENQKVLAEARKDLAQKAQTQGGQLLKEAAAQAASKKYETALAAYQKAAAFRYAPVAAQARLRIAELQKARENARLAAERASMDRLQALARKLKQWVGKKDFDSAGVELSKGRHDPLLASQSAALKALARGLQGVPSLHRQVAKRLSTSGKEGLVIADSKLRYFKLEKGRLYYRHPAVPALTDKAADRATWAERLELAGLRGPGAVSTLKSIPPKDRLPLGGLLALLGEPDQAEFLFQRGRPGAQGEGKALLAAWEALLPLLKDDPAERLAQGRFRALQEQVEARRWDEAQRTLDELRGPVLSRSAFIKRREARIEALAAKIKAAEKTGLAALFKGKLTPLAGGRVRLEYDFSDPAQARDFVPKLGRRPVVVNGELRSSTPQKRSMCFHVGHWRPPVQWSLTGHASDALTIACAHSGEGATDQQLWRNGTEFYLGSRENLARVYRGGQEFFRRPFRLPPNSKPVKIEISYDGRTWTLAENGRHLFTWKDPQPNPAVTYSRWGLSLWKDRAFRHIVVTGRLDPAWVREAQGRPAVAQRPQKENTPASPASPAVPPAPLNPKEKPTTPVADPTKGRRLVARKVIQVKAYQRWVDAKVFLKRGQYVRIQVRGKWNKGGRTPPTGPEGYKRMVGQFPEMSLIGKFSGRRGMGILPGGEFLVGKGWEGKAPYNGRLFFQPNSNARSRKFYRGLMTIQVQVFE